MEFVSELFVVVVDGIQDGQKSLDRFYADYDVVFPKKSTYVAKFHHILQSLTTVAELFARTRFAKKADFYALFAAAAKFIASSFWQSTIRRMRLPLKHSCQSNSSY